MALLHPVASVRPFMQRKVWVVCVPPVSPVRGLYSSHDVEMRKSFPPFKSRAAKAVLFLLTLLLFRLISGSAE